MKKLVLLVTAMLAVLFSIHGVNDRMPVKGYATAVSFFTQLLSNLGQLP